MRALSAIAFGVVFSSFAVAQSVVAKDPASLGIRPAKQVTTRKPLAGVQLDTLTGQPLTEWRSMTQQGQTFSATTNNPVYAPAFDMANCSPNAGEINSRGFATPRVLVNFYGATALNPGEAWYFTAPGYRNLMWADDMDLVPGTEKRTARWIAQGVTIGSATTGSLVMIVETYDAVRTMSEGPATTAIVDSWAWNFGRFNNFELTTLIIDFDDFVSPAIGGLKLPEVQTGGGYRVRWATTNGSGAILPLPFNFINGLSQAMFYSNDPTDPYRPGTNPSNSNHLNWDDDNPGDYQHQDLTSTGSLSSPYSELYNYEFPAIGNTGPGIIHPQMSMFVHNTLPVIRGKVTYSDVSGPRRNPNRLEVEISNGATTINSFVGVSNTDGSYEIFVPSNGTWNVRIKAEHFLAKRADVVVDAGLGINDVILVNADIDNDNEITVFDYIELSSNFDMIEEDPLFYQVSPAGVPRSYSDLDRDGAVTIFDYIILSSNFDFEGQLGD